MFKLTLPKRENIHCRLSLLWRKFKVKVTEINFCDIIAFNSLRSNQLHRQEIN